MHHGDVSEVGDVTAEAEPERGYGSAEKSDT